MIDTRSIEAAIIRAADRLDVAPRRVRAVLRDIAVAVASAHGSLQHLVHAAREPELEEDV